MSWVGFPRPQDRADREQPTISQHQNRTARPAVAPYLRILKAVSLVGFPRPRDRADREQPAISQHQNRTARPAVAPYLRILKAVSWLAQS